MRTGGWIALGLVAVAVVWLLAGDPRSDVDNPAPDRGATGDDGVPESLRAKAPTLRGTEIEEAAEKRREKQAHPLRGRVIEAAGGTAIKGALVFAFCRDGEKGIRLGASDAEGSFELALEPGPYWLTAYHPQYVPHGIQELLAAEDKAPPPAKAMVDVPEEGELPERVLRLAIGRTIRGRVVDMHGKPLVGVPIRIAQGSWFRKLERRLDMEIVGWRKRFPLWSGADGRFAIRCIPPACEEIHIAAYKKGHACRWAKVVADASQPPADVLLELQPNASVSGHVRYADGAPAAGANVGLGARHKWRHWCWGGRSEDVEVGPDGAYKLEDLVPEDVEIEAEWRDPYMAGAENDVEGLRPGEVKAGVDFVIPRRYVFEATVRDPSGKPLKEERIALHPVNATPRAGWRPDLDELYDDVDEDGQLVIASPSPGPFDVTRVTPTESEVLLAGVELDKRGVEIVSKGSTWTNLTVRVIPPEGAELDNYDCSVWSEAASDDYDFGQHEYDEEKTELAFRVWGVAPFIIELEDAYDKEGRPLTTGTEEDKVRVETLPADGVIEVKLVRGDLLTGRVVDPQGRPVPGVRMHLATRDWDEDEATKTPIPIRPDGTFEFRMPADDGDIQTIHTDAPPGYARVGAFPFERALPGMEVTLQPAGSIAGRLVVPPGVEVAGRKLVFVAWDTTPDDPPHTLENRRVAVDASGAFEAKQLPLGRDLRVSIRHEEAKTLGLRVSLEVKTVRPGTDDIEFHLLPGLEIRGKVVVPPGTRLKGGVHVVHHDLEFSDYAHFEEDSDGTFALPGLAPGTYRLAIWLNSKQGYAYIVSRHVKAGTTDLVLPVARTATIRVKVEGDMIYGSVQAWEAGTVMLRGGANSWERDMAIDGLAADATYDLVAYEGEELVGCLKNVRAGSEVTVTLRKGVSMAGAIQLAKPLGRTEVFARGDGCCFELAIGDDGTFEETVLPGRYDIIALHPNGTQRVLARGIEPATDLSIAWN